MQGLTLIVFVIAVAISVTVQSRLLTWLEALNVSSGLIFVAVVVGAALIPVILFAFTVAFLSKDRAS